MGCATFRGPARPVGGLATRPAHWVGRGGHERTYHSNGGTVAPLPDPSLTWGARKRRRIWRVAADKPPPARLRANPVGGPGIGRLRWRPSTDRSPPMRL